MHNIAYLLDKNCILWSVFWDLLLCRKHGPFDLSNHPSSGTAIGSYLKDLAVGGDYDTSLLSAAFDDLKEEGSEGLELFTLTVTVSGTYTQNNYTTTFVMGSSSSETVITGVTLDPTEIVFSGAVND